MSNREGGKMLILTKTLAYRCVSYIICFFVLWFLTRQPEQAAVFSFVIELVKVGQYFVFELAWEKVSGWHAPLARRLILKSLLYRLMYFGLAFCLFALLTEQIREAARLALVTESAKVLQYYLFDRLWQKFWIRRNQFS